jgi:hypothetical protein
VAAPGATLHMLVHEWLDSDAVDRSLVRFVEMPLAQVNDVLKTGTGEEVIGAGPMATAGSKQRRGPYTPALMDRPL